MCLNLTNVLHRKGCDQQHKVQLEDSHYGYTLGVIWGSNIVEYGQSAPSKSLQMIQNWKEGLMHKMVVLPVRGSKHTGELNREEPHEVQKREIPSSAPEKE